MTTAFVVLIASTGFAAYITDAVMNPMQLFDPLVTLGISAFIGFSVGVGMTAAYISTIKKGV
jgi:hypothetical protein